MKRIFAAMVSVLISVAAHADGVKDSFKTIDDAKAMADQVLSDYVSKDQAEALRSLPRFSTSKTDEQQRQQIQKLVAWTASSSEKRGAVSGFKFEASKTSADVVTRLRYVVFGERTPMVFDFYFYRVGADKQWQLSDLRMAVGPMNLFEAGDR